MAEIEVTDPRGIVIRCSAAYWDDHVLRKHPELEDCERIVAQALRAPSLGCVFVSAHHANRHVYYGPFHGRVEMKVVVQITGEREGIVLSATACSNRPNGEELIWPRA